MRLQAFGARTACARRRPACRHAGVRLALARGMREHRRKAIEVRQNDPSRAGLREHRCSKWHASLEPTA
eukprot:1411593-Alexandrium_andersonii.AAC.1